MSVNKGENVQFKVNTNATNYRIDIYRIGYYGGMGARLITTIEPSATLPQTQPACLGDTTTGLIDCGNWGLSASWPVPNDAVSGVYAANLIREDGTAGTGSSR
ncbi:N,N-dimethylformamidase beta subunit family domain-containing protein [Streptosporangium sp. NPDC001682]